MFPFFVNGVMTGVTIPSIRFFVPLLFIAFTFAVYVFREETVIG